MYLLSMNVALVAIALLLQGAGCRVAVRLTSVEEDDQDTTRMGFMRVLKIFVCTVLVLGAMFGLAILLYMQGDTFVTVVDLAVLAAQVYTLTAILAVAEYHWVTRALVVAVCLGIAVSWLIFTNWLTTDLLSMVSGFAVLLVVAFVVKARRQSRKFLLSIPVWAVFAVAFSAFDLSQVFGTGLMDRFADHLVMHHQTGVITMPAQPTPAAVTPDTARAIPPDAVQAAHHAPAWYESILAANPLMVLGVGDIVFPGMLLVIVTLWARHYKRWSLLFGAFAGYVVGAAVCATVVLQTHTAQPALPYLFSGVFAGLWLAAVRVKLARRIFRPRTAMVFESDAQ